MASQYHEASKEALENMLQDFARAGHCYAKLCSHRNLWFMLHAILKQRLSSSVRMSMIALINGSKYVPFLSKLFCVTKNFAWYPLHIIFDYVLKIKYSEEAAKILVSFCTNYSHALVAILSDDIPVPYYKYLTARRMSEMISTLIFPLSPEAIQAITKKVRRRYEDAMYSMLNDGRLPDRDDEGDIYYDAEMGSGDWRTVYDVFKAKAASLASCIRNPWAADADAVVGGSRVKAVKTVKRRAGSAHSAGSQKGGSLVALRKLTKDALKYSLLASGHLLDLIDVNPIEPIHDLCKKKLARFSAYSNDTFLPLLISTVQWSKRFLKAYFEQADKHIAQILGMNVMNVMAQRQSPFQEQQHQQSAQQQQQPIIEQFLPVFRKYACTIGAIVEGSEKRSAVNVRAIVDDLFDDSVMGDRMLEAIVKRVSDIITGVLLSPITTQPGLPGQQSVQNAEITVCRMDAAWEGRDLNAHIGRSQSAPERASSPVGQLGQLGMLDQLGPRALSANTP